MVEEKLLGNGGKRESQEPHKEGSTLRKHIYRIIEKSPKFVKNKLQTTANLGSNYSFYGLHEDAKRLLAPLAQDPLSIQLWESESAAIVLGHLDSLEYRSGKLDMFADYWRKQRDLLLSQASSASDEHVHKIRMEVDRAIMHVAISLSGGRKNDLAQKELASLTSFAFLIGMRQAAVELPINFSIDLIQLRDQSGDPSSKKKTTEFIEENIKNFENAFAHNGKQKQDASRFIARRLLSHGRFDEVEGFIRRVLAEITHSS